MIKKSKEETLLVYKRVLKSLSFISNQTSSKTILIIIVFFAKNTYNSTRNLFYYKNKGQEFK